MSVKASVQLTVPRYDSTTSRSLCAMKPCVSFKVPSPKTPTCEKIRSTVKPRSARMSVSGFLACSAPPAITSIACFAPAKLSIVPGSSSTYAKHASFTPRSKSFESDVEPVSCRSSGLSAAEGFFASSTSWRSPWASTLFLPRSTLLGFGSAAAIVLVPDLSSPVASCPVAATTGCEGATADTLPCVQPMALALQGGDLLE
mmetsp:Transcript_54367/g.138116  ORF Transcript_54367/g.138116 Transcript_54367/m.138116 type:complete len:201 (-) Transcript_54367:32-634(-)